MKRAHRTGDHPRRISQGLELQGFIGLDREYLRVVSPWLRVAPMMTALWLAVGTWLRSSLLLVLVVPVGIASAIGRVHPFDYLYEFVVRPVMKLPSLPNNRPARRFASLSWALWAGAAALFLSIGWETAGVLTGGSLAALAFLAAVTDFCVWCWLWKVARHRSRRSQR